jgi:1-acyl-sn-glycerol-3-phosphate acyltransferase
VLVANHLSYSDANVVEVLLHQAGASEIADRLTVVAGPKVYSNIRRRFSSLCFGTIRVPQSASRSSDEAVMRPREVAVAARRAIQIAHERLRLGEVLLVFGEGSRSRTASMHPFLPGVARYLDLSDVIVVPLALEGTEGLFPLDEGGLTSVPIAMRVGCPVEATAFRSRAQGDRRVMMDAIGFAVAQLVAESYRGVYANRLERERAHEMSLNLFGSSTRSLR